MRARAGSGRTADPTCHQRAHAGFAGVALALGREVQELLDLLPLGVAVGSL
jgi:hypothetical protein